VSDRQAQKKFRHARRFGIQGAYNRENLVRFKTALAAHVSDPAVEVIYGTYVRGTGRGGFPAIFYLRRADQQIVVTDRAGNFVTGYRLRPKQLANVLTIGRLGGG
jgi:hypothetical protein